MRVLLTGASGFVGRSLGAALAARGDAVISVSREAKPLSFAAMSLPWERIAEARDLDAIVHLAGENVAQRWTSGAKDKIVSSRVETLARLRDAAAELRPSVLVSASAIGYYGDAGDEVLREDHRPGTGFLAETCVAWEAAADAFASLTPRIVKLRFGMVLGRGGGALPKMAAPFRLGLGGRVGNGRQWVSWIHIDDLTALLLRSLDSPQMKGVYNAVAPEPVRSSQLTNALAEVLATRARFPVPGAALRLALGEMAEMLLGSQRVSAQKVVDAGFAFHYPKVIEALRASV